MFKAVKLHNVLGMWEKLCFSDIVVSGELYCVSKVKHMDNF